MRDHACRTILDTGISHTVIATTLIKKIQRTKTKQAIELVRLGRLMTRKVFTISIAEKSVGMLHFSHYLLIKSDQVQGAKKN